LTFLLRRTALNREVMSSKFGDPRRAGLAPFATRAANSRGRLYPEPSSPTRTPFQRDRDRIVHSTAFRRLKHKTQVFVYHEGDHYRTRLTHSIEVAQIARSLARALGVDEDLAEALALAHDFGHTPFGHTGEEALDDLMADYGGFDHNAQTLRIVTRLERHYAEFDGLNLTWETLEGLVKHNGPLIGADGEAIGRPVPLPILEYNALHDLELAAHSGLEAQCAAIADDIAYNGHDLDDGLRAGLFSLDDLAEVPLSAELLSLVRERYPALDPVRSAHEVIRRQITAMVEDVILFAKAAIADLAPSGDDDIRTAGHTLVRFSDRMMVSDRAIKAFLHRHMYRAPAVVRIRDNAQIIIRDLFQAYFRGDAAMANEWGLDWQADSVRLDDDKRARHVADFLAGMTDRYAIKEHERLFDATPELR
jgi:dGTPase